MDPNSACILTNTFILSGSSPMASIAFNNYESLEGVEKKAAPQIECAFEAYWPALKSATLIN